MAAMMMMMLQQQQQVDSINDLYPWCSKKITLDIAHSENQQHDDHTKRLPDELLVLIFAQLSFHDLFTLGRVCRRWHQAAFDRRLWARATFTTEQTLIVRRNNTEIMGNAVPDYHRESVASMKMRLISRHASNGLSVWGSREMGDQVHFHVCWGLPQQRFLHINGLHGNQRLSCIRTLSLRGIGDRVTTHFLQEQLLPQMPHLKHVDLTGCFMVGDAAIAALVQGHQRGKILESLSLGRCFGLSGHCLFFIGKYCRTLKHLDLSYGAALSDDRSLMWLVRCRPETLAEADADWAAAGASLHSESVKIQRQQQLNQLQQGSMEHVLTPLVRTLETLDLSNGDFLTEATLVRFLSALTSLPPSVTNLQRLTLSHTFCVNETVLSAIYEPAWMQQGAGVDAPTVAAARQFTLDVTNCDHVNRVQVLEFQRRLAELCDGHPEFACWSAPPHVIENCKVMDDSIAAIRTYLQTLVDAPIAQD